MRAYCTTLKHDGAKVFIKSYFNSYSLVRNGWKTLNLWCLFRIRVNTFTNSTTYISSRPTHMNNKYKRLWSPLNLWNWNICFIKLVSEWADQDSIFKFLNEIMNKNKNSLTILKNLWNHCVLARTDEDSRTSFISGPLSFMKQGLFHSGFKWLETVLK